MHQWRPEPINPTLYGTKTLKRATCERSWWAVNSTMAYIETRRRTNGGGYAEAFWWRGLLFIPCSCRGGGSEGLVSSFSLRSLVLRGFFFFFLWSLLVDIYVIGERRRSRIRIIFFHFPFPSLEWLGEGFRSVCIAIGFFGKTGLCKINFPTLAVAGKAT